MNWQFIEKKPKWPVWELQPISNMKEIPNQNSVRWNFTTHYIEHFFSSWQYQIRCRQGCGEGILYLAGGS